MSDAQGAARQGDALTHNSLLADIFGGVLEIAVGVAIGAAVGAAVVGATSLTVATGGLAACLIGAAVNVAVGVGMNALGADEGISTFCDNLTKDLFPPSVCAYISSGSPNVFINGKPAARAAGCTSYDTVDLPDDQAPEGTFLDIAKGFFSELWQPTLASPAPGASPRAQDQITCERHLPMPVQYLAEGSSTVFINGQPAVRSGDRSTCGATVSSAHVSPNVRIGGGNLVVRSIRSGKTPDVGLAVNALMMLRGGPRRFVSNLPCMLLGGVNAYAVSQVSGALGRAISGSPHPVHAATGAKVLGSVEDLDFSLPGVMPLAWQRFYNSRDERRDGLFGAGWSVTFEVCVHVEEERLIYVDEQARRIDMGQIGVGEAVFSAGEGLVVRRHDDGRVLIESEDGLYRYFEPASVSHSMLRLVQLGDRNDNRIDLAYDAQGRLSELRDSLNVQHLRLGYSAQWPRRVASIERLYDDTQYRPEALVYYSYDASGDLIEVRNASNNLLRRFAYDSGQRMVEHQLPTGLRCFYDWDVIKDREWRVVRHYTDDGAEYRFEYDLEAGRTVVTDGLGRRSVRHWNVQHQITSITDALGLSWQFDWNDERQLLGATDPQGGQWRYTYDAAGNLASTEDPLGRHELTQWLEHWALPRVETDAAGNNWHYRYDARGNCTHVRDPLGHVTQYRYNALGQVVEILDSSGKTRKNTWNAFGQLSGHIDCSGHRTEICHDPRGHLVSTTDALSNETRYIHDLYGRLETLKTPDERLFEYRYDASGRLISQTDPTGATTRLEYDARGQLRQRTDELRRTVQYRYDAYGRLDTLTNENGEHYRFAWDAGDRLIVQQDLDGSQRHFRYDGLGNPLRVEQRPAAVGNNDPVDEPIIHDLKRDAVGRLIAKTTTDGRTEYTYDLLDQLTGIAFAPLEGEQQHIAFRYDALGQLLSEQNAYGLLQHTYDELGNRTQTRLPDGRTLNRLYYGSGHLHQINLDGQVISDFERDPLHREVLRVQGQIRTCTRYDAAGRLHLRIPRVEGVHPDAWAVYDKQYDYDPADNLICRWTSKQSHDRRTDLHYDATARLIVSDDDALKTPEVFAYDAAANLIDGRQQNAEQVRHNRIQRYQDKRYRYDGFGRLIEKQSIRHGTQRFEYDAESRLIAVHQYGGITIRMVYDPLGRRIGKTEHNAHGLKRNETRFAWEGLRLLSEERHGTQCLYIYADDSHEPHARIDSRGEHQEVLYFHNQPNGLPEELTTASGHFVWMTHYRTWGNTHQEERSPYYAEQNLRFQGQYLDRETGLHYNTFRFYDPDVGRFTTPDPIGLAGGLNLYAYAPNPVGWVDPWGLTACGKKVDALRNGPQKVTVSVKSKAEAHELVMEAFPDAQKVRGIGSQDAAGIRKKHKMEQFKKRDGKVRYRKDYPIDQRTGRVYGHDDPKGTGHGELPHINIKRSDGTMVRIDITD
ncbi:RHS repeat-associated core domain-containing protein [Pseudomonas sp. Pseu.R1]|uniref:RHS repeat-associated core domain-containing protein n=1 Tax=Pseudomonas sp. Pseu.R1 TaxID=3379818 RepID=UPI003B9F0A40